MCAKQISEKSDLIKAEHIYNTNQYTNQCTLLFYKCYQSPINSVPTFNTFIMHKFSSCFVLNIFFLNFA